MPDTDKVDIKMFLPENSPIPMFYANSERARTLFIQWGMEEIAVGVAGTFTPTELLDNLPEDWVLEFSDGSDINEQDELIFQEITLPKSVVVLH